jgi:glucose-6-phosphate 1-dehydrogenase
MVGEDVELLAHYHPPESMAPYGRLLAEAIRGEPAAFARQDGVEAAWRIVDPVLGDVAPVHRYEPGSWGPAEADRLLEPGTRWHAPRSHEAAPHAQTDGSGD